MKKIISLLCVACLAFAVACSDDKEVDQAFDSVLTPDFTFDDSEEIIAGVDAVQFIDNSKARRSAVISGISDSPDWATGRKTPFRIPLCIKMLANTPLH